MNTHHSKENFHLENIGKLDTRMEETQVLVLMDVFLTLRLKF